MQGPVQGPVTVYNYINTETKHAAHVPLTPHEPVSHERAGCTWCSAMCITPPEAVRAHTNDHPTPVDATQPHIASVSCQSVEVTHRPTEVARRQATAKCRRSNNTRDAGGWEVLRRA